MITIKEYLKEESAAPTNAMGDGTNVADKDNTMGKVKKKDKKKAKAE